MRSTFLPYCGMALPCPLATFNFTRIPDEFRCPKTKLTAVIPHQSNFCANPVSETSPDGQPRHPRLLALYFGNYSPIPIARMVYRRRDIRNRHGPRQRQPQSPVVGVRRVRFEERESKPRHFRASHHSDARRVNTKRSLPAWSKRPMWTESALETPGRLHLRRLRSSPLTTHAAQRTKKASQANSKALRTRPHAGGASRASWLGFVIPTMVVYKTPSPTSRSPYSPVLHRSLFSTIRFFQKTPQLDFFTVRSLPHYHHGLSEVFLQCVPRLFLGNSVGDCDACGTGHLVPLRSDHRALCAPVSHRVELQPRKGREVHASRAAEAQGEGARPHRRHPHHRRKRDGEVRMGHLQEDVSCWGVDDSP